MNKKQQKRQKLLAKLVSTFVVLLPVNLFADGGVLAHVSIPDDFNVSVVAQDIVHNGHSMEILQFSTRQDSSTVIGHFEEIWAENEMTDLESGEARPAYFVNSVGDWKSVGTLIGSRQIVVQVQPVNSGATGINQTDSTNTMRSFGFISSMDITPMYNPPRPPESTFGHGLLLSTTHSNDMSADREFGGYESTVSTVLVNGSVRQAKDQLVSSYRRSGWAVQSVRDERSIAALLMSRRGETAEVSFVNYDNSRVLVTINRVSRQ